MKTNLLIASILMALTSPVYAEWTTGDTALQATFLTLLAVDRAQTLDCVGRVDLVGQDGNGKLIWKEYHEQGWANKFIGQYPSSGDVNRYNLAVAALHTGIAMILPREMKIGGDFVMRPRLMWQSVWIVIEASTVEKNVSAGVKIQF